MSALTGEPWRGLGFISVRNTASGTTNCRNFGVSINDIDPSVDTPGDQTTWEGTPGSSFTLRLEWNQEGTPTVALPETINVTLRLPGGAAVGSTWSETITAGQTSGTRTRTVHFDSDPLDQVLGAIRAGTLEIHVQIVRTSIPTYDLNSRGEGTPTAGTTLEWARGYLRASQTLMAHSISNASVGGAEPASFAFPDPLHTRLTYGAAWYEAVATELELLRTGLATVEREQTTAAQTAVNHDYSWTATTGTNRRVGNGMQLASEGKDLRAKLATADFGGDNKFIYAATGHEANWTRDSELQLTRTNRITADPRLTVSHLMQMNSDAFTSPPTTGDTASRLTSDLAFLAARLTNARTEGQNAITATLKNWDNATLVGSESSPVNTTSQDSGTQGGEAGWLDTAASKLPLAWDESLPGGAWTVKAVISAPADATGLESGATRTLTLLAPDPRIRVIAGAGVTTSAVDGDHWHPGDPLLIGLAALRLTPGTNVVVTPDASPAPTMFIGRFNVTLARAEYLDSDLTWKAASGASNLYAFPLTASPGDAKVFIKTFTGPETAAWGEATLYLIGTALVGGTPYSGPGLLDVVSTTANAHDAYAFDPIGLFK